MARSLKTSLSAKAEISRLELFIPAEIISTQIKLIAEYADKARTAKSFNNGLTDFFSSMIK